MMMLKNRVLGCESSNVGSAVMKLLRFADSQESRFQASKPSNMGCAALLCGRFAYGQESSIQAANRSKWVVQS